MQTLLTYAADILLMTASLGAAAYCMILSRRLTRLGSFDKGIGSAIAVLSAQVEEMKTALGEAKAGSDGAGQQLNDLVRQARDISAELEMMIAACHDFAETAIDVQTQAAPQGETRERLADEALSGSAVDKAAPTTPPTRSTSEHALTDQGPEVPFVSSVDRTGAAEEPVFGSRRGRMDENTPDDEPMAIFRHRKPADA